MYLEQLLIYEDLELETLLSQGTSVWTVRVQAIFRVALVHPQQDGEIVALASTHLSPLWCHSVQDETNNVSVSY